MLAWAVPVLLFLAVGLLAAAAAWPDAAGKPRIWIVIAAVILPGWNDALTGSSDRSLSTTTPHLSERRRMASPHDAISVVICSTDPSVTT